MPRAWPTRADRWSWLATYHLPWAPGTIAAYSNVSFDLLADAIETADGKALSRPVAGARHRPARHGRYRLCADARAMPAADDRHGHRQARPRASIRMRPTAPAASTAPATTWRAGCATTSRRQRDAGAEPRGLPAAAGSAGRDRLRRGRADGRPRSRLGHRGWRTAPSRRC